jgi:REP element-mobilizing transposase RayT
MSSSEGKKKLFKGKYCIETTRLKNWDYSWNGWYFVTICTQNRDHTFGEIINGKLQNTVQSQICMACWFDLPNHYQNCVLDAFVIMPNHVHGIIRSINNHHMMGVAMVDTGFKPVSTAPGPDPTPIKQHALSEIVRAFKTFTARKINIYQKTQGTPLWQTRFYDRIIRNEQELNRIRQYIKNNPAKWESDRNKHKH